MSEKKAGAIKQAAVRALEPQLTELVKANRAEARTRADELGGVLLGLQASLERESSEKVGSCSSLLLSGLACIGFLSASLAGAGGREKLPPMRLSAFWFFFSFAILPQGDTRASTPTRVTIQFETRCSAIAMRTFHVDA